MIGRRLSIRTRLTLWYSLFFALAQVAMGVAAWFLLLHSLNHVVRETLVERIEGVRRFLATQPPDLPPGRLRAETHEEYESEQDGDWLQIATDQGYWLYQSPLMTQNQVSHMGNRTSHLQPAKIHDKPFFFLVRRVEAHGHLYDVEAGLDTSEFHETITEFRAGLLLLVPIAILLAALGGYWLSGRALAPVDAINRAARSISADNLGRRLDTLETGDELQRLSETLNAMLDRIEVGFRRIAEFTADASHELRTPLALMLTEAEVTLRRPRTPEDYQAALRNILSECTRTASMVEELLVLARADAGVDEITKAPIQLASMLEEIAAEWHSAITARGLELTASLPERDLYVNADRAALRRLFDILLDNASRYTPSPGSIELSCHRENGQARITVRDSGIGISDEDLPHIFERFYRADKARSREQGGAGLGLSIAQTIVRKHEGEIQVASKPGAGSTFAVVLPLITPPQPQAETIEKEKQIQVRQ